MSTLRNATMSKNNRNTDTRAPKVSGLRSRANHEVKAEPRAKRVAVIARNPEDQADGVHRLGVAVGLIEADGAHRLGEANVESGQTQRQVSALANQAKPLATVTAENKPLPRSAKLSHLAR